MNLLPLALALGLSASSPAADPLDGLCVPQVQMVEGAQCPAFGPGDYAARLASVHLPTSLPDLPTYRLERHDPVVDYTYARIAADAPLFATPDDGLAGNVKKSLGKGLIFVNLVSTVQAGDQTFYQIRSGEYVRAGDVSVVRPTEFQGLGFEANPAYPFGWVVSAVRPSALPGAVEPKQGVLLTKRKVVQIYAVQHVGDYDWYLVGSNQWVEQRKIAKVDLNPPPAGVSGKWIQVNLFEQTLAAYEDNRLVYATLVSSGLDKWYTVPGLFQIYIRLETDRMRGSYEPDGSDYYYLEAVPWVMYFDGSRALHGEYWHDRLGFKRSHGCVNLAPLDARWLYDWAPQGTSVWVYDPSGRTPTEETGAGAP